MHVWDGVLVVFGMSVRTIDCLALTSVDVRECWVSMSVGTLMSMALQSAGPRKSWHAQVIGTSRSALTRVCTNQHALASVGTAKG